MLSWIVILLSVAEDVTKFAIILLLTVPISFFEKLTRDSLPLHYHLIEYFIFVLALNMLLEHCHFVTINFTQRTGILILLSEVNTAVIPPSLDALIAENVITVLKQTKFVFISSIKFLVANATVNNISSYISFFLFIINLM